MEDNELDEMTLAEGLVLGFLVGGIATAVVSVAIIWNVAEIVVTGVQKVRALRPVLPVR